MHQSIFWAATLASFTSLAVSQSIDPTTVPISERNVWCNSQITQCPLICLQLPGETNAATDANTCDPTDLTYDCVCANGLSPNASQYSQTIPYFICTQYNQNCVATCNGDNNCQSACIQDHPCGAQNPTRANTSTKATMSKTATAGGATGASAVSTAAGGSAVYSGFGGSAATSTAASGSGNTSAATAMLLNLGQAYGLGVVAAGIFAGFALL